MPAQASEKSKDLVRRFRSVETQRKSNWDPKFQDIADFVLGRRDFTTARREGERREILLYDTTGRTMTNMLAGGLQSLLFNPASIFFKLKTSDPDLMDVIEVRVWLEQVEQVLYQGIFQRPKCRFVPAADEQLLDLVGFGNGVMLAEDPFGRPPLFSGVPVSQSYPCENEHGEIDTMFRVRPVRARNIVRRWGPNAPQKAQQLVAQGSGEDKLEVLHAVLPAEDPAMQRMGFGGEAMPFYSAYIALDGDLMIEESGFHEMPYLTARWRVDSGEMMGRGPCEDALADCKMASAQKLVSLQAGQMGVAPPIITEDDSVVPQLDLRPFGRIIVRSGGGTLNPPVQALDYRPQALIGIEMMRDVRQQIQEAFHFELLKLIQNQGLTPMTAEQVATIRSAVERLLAPILGRQGCDLHGPLIERAYGIAQRRGMIPPPPAVLEGQEFEVEFISPITRAARQSEVAAVDGWFARLRAAAELDETVLDIANLDEMARFYADAGAVPAKLLRTPAQVRKRRAAEAQVAAEQASAETAMQVADVVQKVAPALQPQAGA